MGDPKIAEHLVMQILAERASFDNSDTLGAAASLVMLDCYDRKVLREYFLDVLSSATSLQNYLTRVRSVRIIRGLLDEGILDREKLDEAEQKCLLFAEASRQSLVRSMEQIMLCPTSEDKVN